MTTTMDAPQDGLWHPLKAQAEPCRAVQRVRRGSGTRIANIWRGSICRYVGGGRWETDRCPHEHVKESTADKCALSSVKRGGVW